MLTSFTAHPRRVILLAGLVPLIARLLILPALPIPQPHIADEFGHLLIADTFNAGRLANPPHPFQAHFEACYTLLQPAYASIYPVAQGAVLGLAEFFHVNPWFGVWLSIGLMCMSIAWMLQQWLPPKWAVFGTALVILRLGVMSHWMNSFWGGAMAATGGALAFGAYRRLTRRPNVRDTLLLGLGIAILAQSRPYEGAILTAIVLIAWGWNLVRRRTPDWQARVRFTVLPLAACLVVIAAWTGYYDWRVTGNPLILPYKWYQTLYAMPQSFVIQPPLPPTPAVHHQPEIAANYAWQREAYDKAASWAGYIGVTKDKVRTLWRFYLEVSLSIPLAIFGWWMLRERRLRLLMLATAAVFAAMTLYPMCFPHYAAPLTAAIFALAVQGMRHLHVWKRRTTAFGAAFVWTLFCVRLVMVPIPAGAEDLPPAVVEKFAPRTETAAILHQLGGTHIVFVRYRSGHNIHTGVIFNDADIDGSPVIWARELDEASNRAFMAHYPERTVWLLEADTVPRTLQRYVLPDTASQPTPSPVR